MMSGELVRVRVTLMELGQNTTLDKFTEKTRTD